MSNKIITLDGLNTFLSNFKIVINNLLLSKQDKLISGENIKTVNDESLLGKGNLNISNFIEITYSELKNLRDNSQLIPGGLYRITDYETVISSLTSTSAGHKFDLIVLALNKNTLSEEAKACKSIYTTITSDMTLDNTALNNFEMSATTWESLNNEQIPEDIKKLLPSVVTYDIRIGKFTRNLKQGILQAKFQYLSGNNKINCIGVDLVQNGKVITSDYHKGSTGTSNSNNVYTLAVPANGSYIIRYFIEGNSEAINATCGVYAENYISTYFNNAKIDSWNIKYCLDNDTSRFNWANQTEGKGVIYYMKDEHENECPYDFKNILFNGYYTFSYTLNNVICDGSVDDRVNNCYGNKIGVCYNQDIVRILNNNVFKNTSANSYCVYNNFEQDCKNNTFGDSCVSNSFGNYCSGNSFGNNCQYNTFEDYCVNNTLGNYCQSNTFGVYCQSNSLGSYIIRCAFGKQCISNKFTNGSGTNLEACRMISFGDQCNSVNIYTTEGPSYSAGKWLQNINIANAMSGSIEVNNINGTRTKYVIKNANNNIVQYYDGDFIDKQDIISDLDTIRTNAALGATALQTVPEEYITETELNQKGYLTEHQDISGKQDIISDLDTIRNNSNLGASAVQPESLSNVATTGSYNDLLNKPSEITSSIVSEWGFTKNTGTITGININGTSIATSGTANIPSASASAYGVTKLSSSTSSTSTTVAATSSAVKSAYDLANKKQDKLVSGTNIVTVNGNSILKSGNIIVGDISFEYTDLELNDHEDYSNEYFTIQSLEDNNEVSFSNSIMYQPEGSSTWSTLNSGEKLVLNTNQKVKLKINNPSIGAYGIGTFSASKQYNVKGNIMSLLHGDDFIDKTDLTNKDMVFRQLFWNSTTLINASELVLPATTLAMGCYSDMFYDCTSLTKAPELPATTLASNCYNYMFSGCTGLTTAPSILPATTLANYCYHGMFSGCKALTTAPELPATTLANYCYHYMFSGCSKLNYIKALFTTTPGTSYTSYWLNGVSSTGTFIKNKNATWNVTGVNGIPSGWTVKIA